MSTTPAIAAAATRSSRRGRRRGGVRLVPIVLAAAAVFAGALYAHRSYRRGHTTLRFAGVERTAALELTFFPDRLSFASPSPPPALGSLQVDDPTAITLGRDLVPGQAMVRYRGPGIGAGVTFVELGRDLPPVALRAPRVLTGRIGVPVPLWLSGWRSPGMRPVADAEVVAMGGGERGVDLATTRTDAEGRFTLVGLDGELDGLGLRVRARGHAIHHEVVGRLDAGRESLTVALTPGRSQAGTVAAPGDLDLRALRIVARGLPGVDASIGSDGAFVLDHLPPDTSPRLLLHGLPPQWAYAPAQVGDGAPLRIDIVAGAIVRGRVVDAASRRGLSGALVWSGDSEVVRADANGRFELPRLLPGAGELSAQWQQATGRRRRDWVGHLALTLQPGQLHEGIEIVVVTE